jgi:hypothetical protein
MLLKEVFLQSLLSLVFLKHLRTYLMNWFFHKIYWTGWISFKLGGRKNTDLCNTQVYDADTPGMAEKGSSPKERKDRVQHRHHGPKNCRDQEFFEVAA